jgi:hypothetical protein
MLKLCGFVALCIGALGCQPGYIKAGDLEAKGQGPSACRKSCEDLGMRMTALVLVGNTLPGCVCQPVVKQEPAPLPGIAPTNQAGPSASAASAEEGAAASSTGYVVIAAAAAAAREQQRQQQQQQQQKK